MESYPKLLHSYSRKLSSSFRSCNIYYTIYSRSHFVSVLSSYSPLGCAFGLIKLILVIMILLFVAAWIYVYPVVAYIVYTGHSILCCLHNILTIRIYIWSRIGLARGVCVCVLGLMFTFNWRLVAHGSSSCSPLLMIIIIIMIMMIIETHL